MGEEKPKARTREEINIEYTQLSVQAGEREFVIKYKQAELIKIYERMSQIYLEQAEIPEPKADPVLPPAEAVLASQEIPV